MSAIIGDVVLSRTGAEQSEHNNAVSPHSVGSSMMNADDMRKWLLIMHITLYSMDQCVAPPGVYNDNRYDAFNTGSQHKE